MGVLPRHLPGIWPGSSASMATPFRAESSISESSQSYAPSTVRVGKATGETPLISADRPGRGGKTSASGELP